MGAALALTGGALAAVPPAVAAPPPAAPSRAADTVEVYTGVLSRADLARLRGAGLDHEDIATSRAVGRGKAALVEVEVTTNAATVAELASDGVRLQVKKVKGKTSTEIAALAAAEGRDVFRPYSGPGGIEQELRALTAANPGTTKLVEHRAEPAGPADPGGEGHQAGDPGAGRHPAGLASSSRRSTPASGSPRR